MGMWPINWPVASSACREEANHCSCRFDALETGLSRIGLEWVATLNSIDGSVRNWDIG
jgi:hypothetical protein